MGKNENGVLEPECCLKEAKPAGRKSLGLPRALPAIRGEAERPNPASPRCDNLASYWPPLGVFMKGKTKSIKGREKALEARYK